MGCPGQPAVPDRVLGLARAILASLPSQTAVLGADGAMLAVNELWERLWKDNGRAGDGGIETTAHAASALDVGCTRSHGWLYGHPLAAGEGPQTPSRWPPAEDQQPAAL